MQACRRTETLHATGCVGGRTVKWLSQIALTARDSDNYYHLHDNSLFPPDVASTSLLSKTVADHGQQYEHAHRNPAAGATAADARHPFILHELNVNSAILAPAHGQTLRLHGDLDQKFEFCGYAYDGGGRRITRVELTFDEGESWVGCRVEYPEDYVPEHGVKWYVMCRWRAAIPAWMTMSTKRVSVRAWNQSANTQPERHTWNVLGMMNNAWYTVHINQKAADVLEILHPVSMCPREPQGWMERKFPQVRYEEKNVPPITYARTEVRKHNTVSDCWVVIDNKVYDLTDFLNLHPGGQASIVAHAGEDVTGLFYDIHSEDTHVLKAAYAIGSVAREDTGRDADARNRNPLTQRQHPRVTPDGREVALSSSHWTDVTLVAKVVVNHNTRRFTFALPSREQRMWLPWGKHINVGVELEDRMVVRPYTPVRPILAQEDDGTLQLLVKIYFPTETRPGGEMTQILEGMQLGDIVKIKGPEGTLWYMGDGHYAVHGHFFYCQKMNFIVGGTGITPALAVIKAVVLAERSAAVRIALVFANVTRADILCREELDELVKASSNVTICHVIASDDLSDTAAEPQEAARVAYASGHVNAAILRDHIIPAEDQSSCFLCGPPAMIARAVLPALTELGFDHDHIFEF